MQKPVMSPAVEQDVANALAQFANKDLWIKWGLNNLREQGAAFLLLGSPGTGKTTIAKYIAYKVKKGFKQLQQSELSCDGSPGAYEAGIKKFFEDCKQRHNATIFMDECDALFQDRTSIGEAGRTWQLSGMEQLLMSMNSYRGLVIAATNHPQMMDTAISDRWLSIIHVHPPDFDMRRRLWMQKIPRSFPFQLNPIQVKAISKVELTGRQIETVILNVASNAIRLGKRPTLAMLELFAEREREKRVGKEV